MGGGQWPQKALSAAFVRQVTVPGKRFDANGLCLRVEPNGAKYRVQRITIRGKRCELGLGTPVLVSLAEAREQALENRRLVRAGIDPLAERRRDRAVLSFEEAARKVHELHRPTWKTARHANDCPISLETCAFPRIGALKVGEVTAADILGVLMPIWTEKAETARRVRQRIGTVRKWAVAQGWRQDNPADRITTALPKVPKRQAHRKALPHEQVADCIAAVEASRAGCRSPTTRWRS